MVFKLKQYKIEGIKETDVSRTIPIFEINLGELGISENIWEETTPETFFKLLMDVTRPRKKSFSSVLRKYGNILDNNPLFISFLRRNEKELLSKEE